MKRKIIIKIFYEFFLMNFVQKKKNNQPIRIFTKKNERRRKKIREFKI
jgi:hypothetical protein